MQMWHKILTRLLAVGCLLGVVMGTSACATAPNFRAPEMWQQDQKLAVTAGTYAFGGPNAERDAGVAGAGGSGWILYNVMDAVDVFVGGEGSSQITTAPGARLFAGSRYGGTAGLRSRKEILKGFFFGAELFGEYSEFRGGDPALGPPVQRDVTGWVSLTFAEEIVPDLFGYVRLSGGLRVPLYKEAVEPFGGVTEVPVGLSWHVNDAISLRAEGGYLMPAGAGFDAMPLGGGYLGVGLTFRH